MLEAAGSAVVFAFVLIVTWLATGNGLGSLPAYFRYGGAIASGYSGAMQLEMSRTDEWFYAAAVLVVIATLTFFGVRSAGRREQVGTALILVGYAWWAFERRIRPPRRARPHLLRADVRDRGRVRILAASISPALSDSGDRRRRVGVVGSRSGSSELVGALG